MAMFLKERLRKLFMGIAKKIVPIFLALVFLGSIFVVFTRSGGGSPGTIEMTINFGMPNMVETKNFDIAGNMTTLEILSSYATRVELTAGNIKCIGDYCNTNRTAWKFYVNDNVPSESAEKYIAKDKDRILFRYEEVKKSAETALVFDNHLTGEKVSVTGVALPLTEEGACKVYEQAGFGKCDSSVTVRSAADGNYTIVGLCPVLSEWCNAGDEVSWTTISPSLTIDSIART